MTAAPLPATEAERLALLRDYQILDTPAEEVFDRIVRLASNLIGTPIALVSLIDETRQWFKAKVGLDLEETSRDVAFCSYAILLDDVMEVTDATQDERFKDNPYVKGEANVRFYAGAPLSAHGQNVGTLCVIDTKPRTLSERDRNVLRDLAALVSEEMELRRAGRHVVADARHRDQILTPLKTILSLANAISSSSADQASREQAVEIMKEAESVRRRVGGTPL
ncbi:GAF domain-containing protein [Lacibacterium aquatile]|uniref:GAF domain-containing protein n=1 Tax=Lacibacterium aquatile TaxID=1168082 RepID=A0ABW5DMJ0_9PROT